MQRAAIVFLCAALAGCAANTSSHSLAAPTTYEFRLVSETLKDEWARDPMFWIDNERLVFAAERFENGKRSKVDGLYVWNDQDRTLTQLAEWGGGFCHSDGWVSYFVRRDGHVHYREGRFGNEQETDLGPPQVGRVFPKVRCRAVPSGSPPYPPRHVPLIGGGVFEYADLDVEPQKRVYRYYPEGVGSPGIDLPFEPVFVMPGSMRYSEYARAYVFSETRTDRKTGVKRAWQLAVTGEVTPIDIPRPVSSYGVLTPLPTARGWLLATPLHGVWLMRGSVLERVTPGSVRDFAVSPDGCRAALKMDFSESVAMRAYPVFVMTLC